MEREDAINDLGELGYARKVEYMRHVRHDYVDEEEYPVTRRDEKEKQYY